MSRMTGLGRPLVAAALFLTLLLPPCEATTPWVPSLELLEELRNAHTIGDQFTRQATIREVLVKHLLSSDDRYARDVWQYLIQEQRWLDLAPYSDVFWTYSEICRSAYVADLPRRSYLRRAPVSERYLVYREALRTGRAEVPPWRQPCSRAEAILGAVHDGLAELEDDIRAAYTGAEVHGEIDLHYLLLTLELRAGGVDREDAARLAAERLGEMNALEFRRAMEEDPVFRVVVNATVDDVCDVNPFDGSQPPGCASILEIFVTQLALALSERTEAPSRGDARDAPDWDSLPKWLVKMARTRTGGTSFRQAAYERCTDPATGTWALERCLGQTAER